MRNKLDVDHILSLTDSEDHGLCPPSMDAQVAVNELSRYFLGEDWYVVIAQTNVQVNTEIVYEIERLYKGCKIPRKKKKNILCKYKEKDNMRKEVKEALDKLKKMCLLRKDINNCIFLNTWNFEHYAITEIEEIFTDFIDEANKYLESKNMNNYIALYDGTIAFIMLKIK